MKIAVLRALQLGDFLCAVPALRALRAAYPDASVTLIGLPWTRAMVRRFDAYLDDFVEFPGFLGMPEGGSPRELPKFFAEMRERAFDLAVQMHGSGRSSNRFVARLQPRSSVGYFEPGAPEPVPERFLAWRAREHEVERCLRLAARVGAPSKGSHLEFPLGDADWREFRALDRMCDLARRPYAVVHAGSQLASRRWPAGRFAQVADALAADGMQVLLTGVASEAPLAALVKGAMRRPALDLTGRTSLGGLAALVARARLVVCNDTGISHIAAAMRTPSVVVACGSDPARWAPLNRELHRVLAHPVECRPCRHAECPIGHPCARGVEPVQVLSEIRRLVRCAA
ncbi:MAG TPA: glycosyltransferase family 9 protein [Myxococcota bacterium]|jgi:ADP-heptose:LPS heptosyltransferase|nr:glycosyltransferase family 9 protein [Myxococcota bacterium]